LKIVFFTYYYPPDLCAGSFRAIALTDALSKRIGKNIELHIISTHPNRYEGHTIKANDMEVHDKVTIHRISVTGHKNTMFSQARAFFQYAFSAYQLTKKLKPNFIIGTTSRLMTGLLTGVAARRSGCNYFIDLRDIFSETISDIFSRKSKLLGLIFKSTFSFLEKKLLNKASGVNVVSEEFPEYFQSNGVNISNWSFFPNGVDKDFIGLTPTKRDRSNSITTILYAGNIGSGQGLESILPYVAKILGDRYHFLIIGDGNTRKLLSESIRRQNINNIKILPPVSRAKLIDYYQNADMLFLHLNSLPAFHRVLPSKIFEYAALGKPIIAGLSGYSAQFLKNNVPYSSIFSPGDVDDCINSIKEIENLHVKNKNVSIFVDKYSREKIMNKMAKHIVDFV